MQKRLLWMTPAGSLPHENREIWMHLRQARSLVSTMSFQSPGAELPARVLKQISALGHHVAAWGEALEALRRRLQKDRLPETWQAHVRAALPASVPAPKTLTVPIRVIEKVPGAWVVEPEHGLSLPALTAGARALLHLPTLHKTWAGWLRGSVLEDLQLRLARAWIVDSTPLPAQGALPGLGIARWGDWARLANSGRRFRIAFLGGETCTLDLDSREADWQMVADQLAVNALDGAVMEELPTKDGTLLTVSFALREGRWERTE